MGVLKKIMFHAAIAAVIIYSLPINAEPLDKDTFKTTMQDFKSTNETRYTMLPPGNTIISSDAVAKFPFSLSTTNDYTANSLYGYPPLLYTNKPTAQDLNPVQILLKTLAMFCDPRNNDDCNLFGPNAIFQKELLDDGKNRLAQAYMRILLDPLRQPARWQPGSNNLPEKVKAQMAQSIIPLFPIDIAKKAMSVVVDSRKERLIPGSDGKNIPLNMPQIADLLAVRFQSSDWRTSINNGSTESILRELALMQAHQNYLLADSFYKNEHHLVMQANILAILARIEEHLAQQAQEQVDAKERVRNLQAQNK